MRRALAWTLLALLAAPAARAADDVADLVARLGSDDGSECYAAFRKLSDSRPPEAVPLLVKGLPGFPRLSQSYGWSLLLGYPQAELRKVAERWSADAPPYLKASSSAWLLRNGEPKAAARIVEAIDAVKTDAVETTWVLGQLLNIDDPRVLAAIRALVRPDADVGVVGAAFHNLRIGKDAAAREPAEALLTAEAGHKALAAAFLWRMGEEEHGKTLGEALATGEVPAAAFSRVYNLLHDADRLPDAVLDALVAMIASPPQGYPLSTIVRLIGRHPYPKAVDALKPLLDRDDDTGKAAFEALSAIPGAIGPDVAKALLQSGDELRRVAAAEALRRTDDLSGLVALVDVLKNGSKARDDAARALGGFRVKAAVDPLIDALLDKDPILRSAAQSSLASILSSLFPYRRLDLASTGYDARGDDAARDAAVAKIRAWWKARRDGAW